MWGVPFATPILMSKTLLPSAKEKLIILQQNDSWRSWRTLDDQRRCAICDHIFPGRKVIVAADRHGRHTLHCPTPGCTSTPREWLLPGDPLTSEDAWNDWLRILDEAEVGAPFQATSEVTRHTRAFF